MAYWFGEIHNRLGKYSHHWRGWKWKTSKSKPNIERHFREKSLVLNWSMVACLSWLVAMEQFIWVNNSTDQKWPKKLTLLKIDWALAQWGGHWSGEYTVKGTFTTSEDRLIMDTQRNGCRREIQKNNLTYLGTWTSHAAQCSSSPKTFLSWCS